MNSLAEKRIDAALERNLETISTQLRRPIHTNKTSQLTQHDLQLFDSTSNGHCSREMTPDSINEESMRNYPRSIIPPTSMDPYGQPLWSAPIYPYPAHQHPGLYLPYPTASTNGLPPFYSAPIDPQILSAFYTQQQAAATARFLQEQGTWPDMHTPSKDANTINEHSTRMKKNPSNLTRLSPDLLSDGDGGGTNDADSIISIDSIKSNSAISKQQKRK